MCPSAISQASVVAMSVSVSAMYCDLVGRYGGCSAPGYRNFQVPTKLTERLEFQRNSGSAVMSSQAAHEATSSSSLSSPSSRKQVQRLSLLALPIQKARVCP
mmetsp:Transcript_44987/g.90870  ORF Transcript_44987/g.90870 Transcript_44987/m.90870 type:complete len:102 (-) Transcript_44987:935-1240(-)